MNNVMLDIETLGTDPGCPVIAIGAVKFDADSVSKDTFYLPITLQSNFDYGLKPSAATIEWWMGQETAAKTIFGGERFNLAVALQEFQKWFSVDSIWGNSARFDCGILLAAYQAVGLEAPWRFWHEKCYRTVKGFAPHIELVREGTHHNALDDARSQAEHLIMLAKVLRIEL